MAATKRLSNTLSHLQSFSPDGLEKCRRQLLDGLNEVLLHYLYKSDPKVHTSCLATMFLRYVVWKIVQAFRIQLYGPLSFSLFFPNHIQTSSDVHGIWRLKIYAGEFGCVLMSGINEPVQDSCVWHCLSLSHLLWIAHFCQTILIPADEITITA